jgi:transglutaminase/protease-like cytokinesis protein 3
VTGIMTVTTGRVFVGTRLAASLHVRSAAKDAAETTVISAMSSTPEMHATESKASAEIRSVKSKNIMMKGTMIIVVLTTANLTKSCHRKRDTSQEASRHIHDERDMKRVRCPVNFMPSGFEKYDGSTNSAEWLEVYQLAIEAARGDSYIMANYLLFCLSSSKRTWLLGLPAGSVRSWNHLR